MVFAKKYVLSFFDWRSLCMPGGCSFILLHSMFIFSSLNRRLAPPFTALSSSACAAVPVCPTPSPVVQRCATCMLCCPLLPAPRLSAPSQLPTATVPPHLFIWSRQPWIPSRSSLARTARLGSIWPSHRHAPVNNSLSVCTITITEDYSLERKKRAWGIGEECRNHSRKVWKNLERKIESTWKKRENGRRKINSSILTIWCLILVTTLLLCCVSLSTWIGMGR